MQRLRDERKVGSRGTHQLGRTTAWRSGLHELSNALGIATPPNAPFVLALLFVLVLLLHFSTVISKLSDRSTTLTQRLALMEERLRELEGRPQPAPPQFRDVSASSDPPIRRR